MKWFQHRWGALIGQYRKNTEEKEKAEKKAEEAEKKTREAEKKAKEAEEKAERFRTHCSFGIRMGRIELLNKNVCLRKKFT